MESRYYQQPIFFGSEAQLNKDYKKYLDGLIGHFVIKVGFNMNNVTKEYEGRNSIADCCRYIKRTFCNILYFELIED